MVRIINKNITRPDEASVGWPIEPKGSGVATLTRWTWVRSQYKAGCENHRTGR